MYRNFPPSLLETLDSFGGNTQQKCHLNLSLGQMVSNLRELLVVHSKSPVCFSSWYHNVAQCKEVYSFVAETDSHKVRYSIAACVGIYP